MSTYFVLMIVIGAALGQGPNGLTVDEITSQVVFDMDDNHDGFITESELVVELVFRWDKNFDLQVSHAEFVEFWTKTYLDSQATTVTFFNNLDFDHDGFLSTLDISHHLAKLDVSGDRMVTFDEFKNFMHLMHPDGVRPT